MKILRDLTLRGDFLSLRSELLALPSFATATSTSVNRRRRRRHHRFCRRRRRASQLTASNQTFSNVVKYPVLHVILSIGEGELLVIVVNHAYYNARLLSRTSTRRFPRDYHHTVVLVNFAATVRLERALHDEPRASKPTLLRHR